MGWILNMPKASLSTCHLEFILGCQYCKISVTYFEYVAQMFLRVLGKSACLYSCIRADKTHGF